MGDDGGEQRPGPVSGPSQRLLPAKQCTRNKYLYCGQLFRYASPMRPMLASAHYATRKGLNRPFARVTAQRPPPRPQALHRPHPRAGGTARRHGPGRRRDPRRRARLQGPHRRLQHPARHARGGAAPHPHPARPPPPDGGHGPGRCPRRHLHHPPGAHGQGPGPHPGGRRDRRQQACGPAGTGPAHPQPLTTRASPVRRHRPAGDAAGGVPPARRAAAGACGGARRGGGG